MITSVAQSIASFLSRNEIIESEKLDIYIYGFEVMISNTISILIGIILGIVFSQLAEAGIFLLVFVFLRRYCGGYHAQTYLKCNLVFGMNITIVMLIINFIETYPMYLKLIIITISILVVAKLAPIENKYKPLTSNEKKKHNKTAIILVLIFSVLSIFLGYKAESYSIIIDTALSSVAVSMVIEYLKKGCEKNEKI